MLVVLIKLAEYYENDYQLFSLVSLVLKHSGQLNHPGLSVGTCCEGSPPSP
jgi:hypothetical protein